MRKLPPLNALKVFEECAKQKSFTAASQILLISQSAVSKHIKNLEDWFGYNLFEKGHKHLELTPRGRTLAVELHTVFDKVEGLRDQLTRNGSRLYLKAPPSFASRWLMPRLHTYAPGSMSEVLELGIGSENVDFRTDPFDAAVVCSTAIHDLSAFGRDIMVGEIINERLTPVMSEDLYRRSDLLDPSDLSKFTLLHPWSSFDYWTSWLSEAGVTIQRASEQFFDLMETAIQAALHGLGIALVNPEFVKDELKSGRLVCPFPAIAPVISSYQFIYPRAQANHVGVVRFRHWLRLNADIAAIDPVATGFGTPERDVVRSPELVGRSTGRNHGNQTICGSS